MWQRGLYSLAGGSQRAFKSFEVSRLRVEEPEEQAARLEESLESLSRSFYSFFGAVFGSIGPTHCASPWALKVEV